MCASPFLPANMTTGGKKRQSLFDRVTLELEAAIGIEPMNKGFAVLAKFFAQDRLSVHTCIFINLLANLACR